MVSYTRVLPWCTLQTGLGARGRGEKRTFCCNISRQEGKCRASYKVVQSTVGWQSHQGSPQSLPIAWGGEPPRFPSPWPNPSKQPRPHSCPGERRLCWLHSGGTQKPHSRAGTRGERDKSAQPPLTDQGLKGCYSLGFKGFCKFINRLKFQSLLFPTHAEKWLQS